MKKTLLVGFAILLSVMIFSPVVVAQTKPSETVDLDLTMAPIDSALKILFSGKGLNYTLDSNVQGIVKEVHLKGVPFDTALKTLLKQVDPPLVYRKEGDVYLISVKKEVPKVDTVTTTVDTSTSTTGTESLKSEDMKLEKITLRFLDAYELKAMIEGGTDTSRGYGGTGWGGTTGGFGGSWGGNTGGWGSGWGGTTGGFGGGWGGNTGGWGSGWGGNTGGWGSGSWGSGGYGTSYGYGTTGTNTTGFGIRYGGTRTGY